MKKDIFAIVIGISYYRNQSIQMLPGAEGDALKFARALKNWGIPEENITLLLSEEASFSNFSDSFSPLLAKKESFQFIFYFCGHGYRSPLPNPISFLQLYDISSNDQRCSLDFLNQTISQLQASDSYLFIDACSLRMNHIFNPSAIDELKGREKSQKNLFFLFSSGAYPSYESLEEKYGYFTEALLKSLSKIRLENCSPTQLLTLVNVELERQRLPLSEMINIGTQRIHFLRPQYPPFRGDEIASLQDTIIQNRGKIICLIGEEGMGKSTLCRCLISSRLKVFLNQISEIDCHALYIIDDVEVMTEGDAHHLICSLKKHKSSFILVSKYSLKSILRNNLQEDVIDWKIPIFNRWQTNNLMREIDASFSENEVECAHLISCGNPLKIQQIAKIGRSVLSNVEEIKRAMSAIYSCGLYLNESLFCRIFCIQESTLHLLKEYGVIVKSQEAWVSSNALYEITQSEQITLIQRETYDYFLEQIEETPDHIESCRSFLLIVKCLGYQKRIDPTLKQVFRVLFLAGKENLAFLKDGADIFISHSIRSKASSFLAHALREWDEIELADSLENFREEEQQPIGKKIFYIVGLFITLVWLIFSIQIKGDFIEELKNGYLSHSKISTFVKMRELPIQTLYTRLSIIGDKKDDQELKDDRIPTYETLFSFKSSIEVETLFEHSSFKNPNRKRVVVFGTAGIGKSTFCQYVAHQWANQKIWGEFKTLLILKIRNLNKEFYPNRAEKYTLEEILARECNLPLIKIRNFLKSDISRQHSLLILDGLDELPMEADRGHLKPVFDELIHSFSHLLITSRPQTILPAYECDTKMEILGFDQESIHRYIDNFFLENPEKAKNIKDFIQQNSLIYSLVHTPINLELICSLFSEKFYVSNEMSTKLTSIYYQITNWLYKRYLLVPGTSIEPTVDIYDQNDFTHHKIIAPLIKQISKTAWMAMEKNTLYLSQSEVAKILPTSSLNEVKKLGLIANENYSLFFIHLTFQEFFAAQYLANLYLNPTKKEKRQEIISQYKFEPRFTLVLSMMVGCLSQQNHTEALNSLFEDLYSEPRDLGQTYELILFAKCFEECLNPSEISFYPQFIRQVVAFLRGHASVKLKADLLSGNSSLLNDREIIDFLNGQILATTPNDIPAVLETVAERHQQLPSKIIETLISFIENPQSDVYAKGRVASILGEMIRLGYPCSERIIEALFKLLKTPMLIYYHRSMEESYAKNSSAMALAKIAISHASKHREAIIEGLNNVVIQKEQSHLSKKNAAFGLAKIINEVSFPYSQQAFERLISALRYKSFKDYFQSVAANALAEVVKKGKTHAERALNELVDVFHQEKDSYIGSCVAEALAEVALSNENKRSKKAFDVLAKAVSRQNLDAIYALLKIAKGGKGHLKEALDVLSTHVQHKESIVAELLNYMETLIDTQEILEEYRALMKKQKGKMNLSSEIKIFLLKMLKVKSSFSTTPHSVFIHPFLEGIFHINQSEEEMREALENAKGAEIEKKLFHIGLIAKKHKTLKNKTIDLLIKHTKNSEGEGRQSALYALMEVFNVDPFVFQKIIGNFLEIIKTPGEGPYLVTLIEKYLEEKIDYLLNHIYSQTTLSELCFFTKQVLFVKDESYFTICKNKLSKLKDVSLYQHTEPKTAVTVSKKTIGKKDIETFFKPVSSVLKFGKEEWKKIFDVDIKEESKIPLSILAALEEECPFYKGKKVFETHFLFYLPSEFTLDLLSKKYSSLLQEHSILFRENGYSLPIIAQSQKLNRSASQWVLAPIGVVKTKQGESFSNQMSYLKYAHPNYELASTVQAIVSYMLYLMESDWIKCEFIIDNVSKHKYEMGFTSDNTRDNPEFSAAKRREEGVVVKFFDRLIELNTIDFAMTTNAHGHFIGLWLVRKSEGDF